MVAAAQLGPIAARRAPQGGGRAAARAAARGRTAAACELVVYPELALTTFFPRWYLDDIAEADHFYETRDAVGRTRNRCSTRPRRLGIGFRLGYAEHSTPTATGTATTRRSSSSATARSWPRYRKVHIPGHERHEPDRPFQHPERRYFEPGPTGFGVWRAFGGLVGMMICNDRRWPETYRVMGLQGVELILCGYNTPIHYAPDPSQDILQGFHNALVMQAGAYQNGTWVVGVAKGGRRGGRRLAGRSRASSRRRGQIVAQALTTGDELIVARCDLDWCAALQGHALRLRPLPPARGLRPDHRPARRGTPAD